MLIALFATLLIAAPLESDQLPLDYAAKAFHQKGPGAGDGAGGVLGRQANGSVLGVDSIPNFSSYFYRPGLVPSAFGAFVQFTWPYTMVGRAPFA